MALAGISLLGSLLSPAAEQIAPPRCYELRIYHAAEGKLDALNARFREHTTKLFARHGMTNIGYFTPSIGQPGADDTLLYFLIHTSPEAQAASFSTFRADPDWIKVKADSEIAGGGSLTVQDGVKSLLLIATDYSPVP